MTMKRRAGGIHGSVLITAAILAVFATIVRGAEPQAGPSLEHDILPLLKTRCQKCHGPVKPKGKLNLSSARSLARGGESGPVVVPGNLDESLIWDQVSTDEMPPRPGEPLSSAEKLLLRQWIEQGAKNLPDAAAVSKDAPWTDHWAFGPPRRPTAPTVRNLAQVRTVIDRFIQRTLEEEGLTLGPSADRTTLIRRLSFDLTGLPPSSDEITAFVNDTEPDAYNRLLERLLASRHYGERWGKYWLEACGYSDSNGYFSADSDRPLAYRYRDYVIRAFNADRPLDQIVREQIAGDELAGERQSHYASSAAIDQLVATHFLRNGQDGTGESDGNADEVRADKYAVLEGAIQIIGSSLLGLTLQCAKCHDHKFEPVTQKDFYQLQAVLFPAFNVEHWVKPNDRIVIAGPRSEQSRWEAHDKTIDAQIESLKRSFASEPGAAKKEKDLQKILEAMNARRHPNPGRIAWIGDVSGSPSEIPLLVRGDLATPGPKVGPGVPAFLTDPDNGYMPASPFAGSSSTGRRLAFARWLTRPGTRPAALLARVLVNRIWQHHFGTGLAATSDNLGYTGSPPTHPELLELLSAELVHSGWTAKALHRLILSSSVFRQSSLRNSEESRQDPDNRLLARFPLRRLDAEAIRDAMLAASGELDDRQGGPYIPTDRTPSGDVVVAEGSPGATRRSIYLQQRRTQTDSLLEVFDAPSLVTTCTRRSPSTMPLQSLSLLNSDFVTTRARKLAARLDRDCASRGARHGEDEVRIARAFQLTLNRAPVADELSATRRFLQAQRLRYSKDSRPDLHHDAWADLCQMLLASNAFLYLD
jgi:Protein of unknown function (DUF1553)/Protein of unknown function (DUF1549)/Planctomycete cytochrome C